MLCLRISKIIGAFCHVGTVPTPDVFNTTVEPIVGVITHASLVGSEGHFLFVRGIHGVVGHRLRWWSSDT